MQQKRRVYPWQRWRRRVIIGCLLCFVVLPAALAAIAWRGQAALDKEIQAIRAKGFPATPADLEKSYPSPAKEQNAGETYQQSFAAQDKTEQRWQYDDLIKQVDDSAKRNLLAEALHRQMTEYLEDNAGALRLLHEAAGLPESRYPLDFTKGFQLPLPHLAKVRQAVRLLQIEAFVAAEDGDTRRALDAVTAALAAGNSVRREPVLISQLVHIACHGITVSTVNRMINIAAFSDTELAQLDGALRAEEDPGAFTRALAGERALGLTAFDHPEQILSDVPEIQSFGPGAASAAAGLIRITGMVGSDRSRYLSVMDDMVAASQRPIYEANAVMAALESRLQAGRSWIPSFTDSLVPGLVHVGDAFARDAAIIANAETAVAIERYRLVHDNAVPERLEELVPVWLVAVPVDPFDGNPLRYRRDDTGYTVYSVDQNMRDDGGKPAARDQRGRAPDLVFRVEHAPAAAN